MAPANEETLSNGVDHSDSKPEQVAIIGSGPAAHTAAIYLARAELQPLLFEGFLAAGVAAGGQLTTTTDVENFPGFPDGITGPEICKRFRDQSENSGTRILTETVASVDLSKRPFKVVGENGTEVMTQSIVLATGATAKRLDIEGAGEDDGGYWQRGISACAVCDGAAPIFRNGVLFVIGGGDSATEEAIYLTKYARKVYIVHRRDELRASMILRRRAKMNDEVEILYSHVIEKVTGDGMKVTKAFLKDKKSGKVKEMDCNGIFFAIGHIPNTKFLNGQVKCDEQGYVLTEPDSTKTNVPGVFAAGDVQDRKWRQAITAAGTGCMAALEIEEFLHSINESNHSGLIEPVMNGDTKHKENSDSQEKGEGSSTA